MEVRHRAALAPHESGKTPRRGVGRFRRFLRTCSAATDAALATFWLEYGEEVFTVDRILGLLRGGLWQVSSEQPESES